MMLFRETLPEDRIEWLRDELLGWIVRLCSGPGFVTTKLCLAVSSLVRYDLQQFNF
jgi:hypothetical protein